MAGEEDIIKIKLEVAQRFYEVNIARETEYYYREAEKLINEKFLQFSKLWTFKDHQDILAKVLIDFVIRWIENEERLNQFDEELIPDMEKLKSLAEAIDID
ncbi:MAG: cell division protein ZapA [Bacteroidales bacterium]|nr:cell division protein ZapA [Bacteroidales bacterium]